MRIILLILGLALYGAYALIEDLTDSREAQSAAVETAPSSLLSAPLELAGAAFDAATGMAGLGSDALPEYGCSESLLSVENLETLIAALPAAQQEALVQVLNLSSSVWTAQLYVGELGYGVCLPVHDKVLLLPEQAHQAVAQLQALLPQ